MNDRNSLAAAAANRLPLGSRTLDLLAGELTGDDGLPVRLRRQALELLLVLGRRHGQVVRKDALMDAVWPDVHVGETSLAQAVTEIRRALGDSEHRLLRTVARRGYLLVPDGDAADAPPLSIAVLPIAVEGDEPASPDWFVDALHGDLIDALARLSGSRLIAQATVRTCAPPARDPRQIARELRVRHIVAGRLRQVGPHLRLRLSLLDGDTGQQRWSDGFAIERARLPVQLAEWAVEIERALTPAVVHAEQARRRPLAPAQIGADDLAMQVMAACQCTLDATLVRQGIERLEQALALDAGCARAWGLLAFLSVQGAMNGWLDDRDAARARAEAAATQLERLDRGSYYAEMARVILAFSAGDGAAMLRLALDWRERLLHPAPWAAAGLALLLAGRADEAIASLTQSLRLSPRDPMRAEWQHRIALAHWFAGNDDEAAEWSQTAEAAHPALTWPPIHAAAWARQGHTEAARAALAAHSRRHAAFEPRAFARRFWHGGAAFLAARDALIATLEALDR